MSRADWLKARRAGIGGSDIGSILQAQGAYGTPLSVWLDKCSDEEPEEVSPEQQARFDAGNAYEAGNLALFEKTTGAKVLDREALIDLVRSLDCCRVFYDDGERLIVQSTQWPCLLASVDAVALYEGEPVIVDAKWSMSPRTAEHYDESELGVPESHYLQVQLYLAVFGLTKGAISAQILGRHVAKIFDRDEDAITRIVEAAEDMARRVVELDEPDPVGDDADLLRARFPASDGELIDAGPEGEALDLEYLESLKAYKAAERRHKDAKALWQAKIAGHYGAHLSDGTSYTWRPQEQARGGLTTDQWSRAAEVLEAANFDDEVVARFKDCAAKGPVQKRVLYRHKAKKGAKA